MKATRPCLWRGDDGISTYKMREISVLRELKHMNIIRVHHVISTDEELTANVYVVTELGGGDGLGAPLI